MTLVKICGLTTIEDVEAARSADFNGFVIESGTRRSLLRVKARDIMSTCSRPKVVITTSQDPTFIEELVNTVEPDVVQVHSLIGKERLSVLSRAACDVWGLVPIGSGDEIERAKEMFSVSDCVVLDTCCQQFGGSGKVHDWDISADIRTIYPDRRVSLSGGLCPENMS